MSRHELVAAYSSGRIGRRAFITGLTGVGVTATAAAAYATALEPHTAKAQNFICEELYPPQLTPPDLPELPPQASQNAKDRLAEIQVRLNQHFAEAQERLDDRFNQIRQRLGCDPL